MRFFAVTTLLTVAARPAVAQEDEPRSPRERALDLYDTSLDRYREGDFEGAITLLERAYALYPEPVLLYNLARAHEGLQAWDAALDAYRRYLDSAEEVPDRGAITRRVTEIEALQARLAEERAEEPSAAPWVLVTAGGLGLITGGVLAGVALERREAADAMPAHRDAAETFRLATDLALASTITLIASGVIGVVGAVWAIVEWTDGDDGATSALELRTRGTSVHLVLRH